MAFWASVGWPMLGGASITTWTCNSLFAGVGTAATTFVVVPSVLGLELAKRTTSFLWTWTSVCASVPAISAPGLTASTSQVHGLSENLVFEITLHIAGTSFWEAFWFQTKRDSSVGQYFPHLLFSSGFIMPYNNIWKLLLLVVSTCIMFSNVCFPVI